MLRDMRGGENLARASGMSLLKGLGARADRRPGWRGGAGCHVTAAFSGVSPAANYRREIQFEHRLEASIIGSCEQTSGAASLAAGSTRLGFAGAESWWGGCDAWRRRRA